MLTLLKRILRKLSREIYFTKFVQQGLLRRKSVYRFEEAKSEWSHVPVDEIGYLNSAELVLRSESELKTLAQKFEKIRYNPKGWRNWDGLWRKYSGVDSVSGKRVLDFGCGFGIEALQFSKNGNRVSLADISPHNLGLAEKVLRSFGLSPAETILVFQDTPFFDTQSPIDLFYSNGVLHHTPRMREILRRAAELLAKEGEIRLMLYSDVAWRIATHAPLPPIDKDITQCPDFFRYVRYLDSYGEYADWYNREKLEYLLGDFLKIREFNYITRDRRYLMTTLVLKGSGSERLAFGGGA